MHKWPEHAVTHTLQKTYGYCSNQKVSNELEILRNVFLSFLKKTNSLQFDF